MAGTKAGAKKAAQTKLQIKYNKQVARLLDFQTDLESRGYRFTGSALPKTPKKITPASVRKLERITPQYIAKKATFLDDETGRIISGEKAYKRHPVQLKPPTPKKQKPKKAKPPKPPKITLPQAPPSKADLIIDNFEATLMALKEGSPKVADFLLNKLQQEIDLYGKNVIAQQLTEIDMSEVNEAIYDVLHYEENHPRHQIAIQNLYTMITLTVPSIEEIMQLSLIEEEDEDYLPFE